MSVESRIFVDTNVIAYAYDRASETKRASALPVIRELWESRRGCVSVQVLQELFVTLTAKLDKPLGLERARRVVEHTSEWHVHTPNGEDVLAAIRLHERYRISFCDSMIVRSASALACDVLLSEDLNAGQRYDGVLVVNPFAQV